MGDLTTKLNLGDISFGAPEGVKLLHTPWGYYTFLGLTKDATFEEIHSAYRKLALRWHPDHGGDPERFKSLECVKQVLLDDGGLLGPEHSRRLHYDTVCALDSGFPGFIQLEGDRTKKLSEIMLIQLELERKSAKNRLDLIEKCPELADLEAELKKATSDRAQKKVIHEIHQTIGKATGRKIDQRAINLAKKRIREEHKSRQIKFLEDFQANPKPYLAKVLDVFYATGGYVTFGVEPPMQCGLITHENRPKVLEIIIGGDCTILGFSKVHFKAPKCNLTIYDPNLEGIFQIIEGQVEVRYAASSYGGVMRVRSPHTRVLNGFAQKDDLYTPQQFATQNWWKKKPTLEITVQNGGVTLQIENPYSFIGNHPQYQIIQTIYSQYLRTNLNDIKEDSLIFNKWNKDKYRD